MDPRMRIAFGLLKVIFQLKSCVSALKLVKPAI
jgi:hypothetical protein